MSQESKAAMAFMKAFDPGESYRQMTERDRERLARVPSVLLEIVARDGWCSYKRQVLWTCDPDDWKDAARAWFPDAQEPQVLARTAFGDLIVWDQEWMWLALVHDAVAMKLIDDPAWFFEWSATSSDFTTQKDLPRRVKAARESAGTLEWDEMYTYVPALALGGSEDTSRVDRVKAREALSILASLTPIRRA
jgi:hypothetical protein